MSCHCHISKVSPRFQVKYSKNLSGLEWRCGCTVWRELSLWIWPGAPGRNAERPGPRYGAQQGNGGGLGRLVASEYSEAIKRRLYLPAIVTAQTVGIHESVTVSTLQNSLVRYLASLPNVGRNNWP
jgi:hypothetical protein